MLEKRWEERRESKEGNKGRKENRKVSVKEREEDWAKWKELDRTIKEKGGKISDIVEDINKLEGPLTGEAIREVLDNTLDL